MLETVTENIIFETVNFDLSVLEIVAPTSVLEIVQGNIVGDGLSGPQGPMGPAGPQGAQGPQGPQGPVGTQGATGAVGPQGPTGDTGPQGPIGNTGPQGPVGATGPQGLTGLTGAAGPQGPIGNTGPAGATGAAGPQGPIGNTGPAGATGAAGLQGPIGNTGPAGATGATGPQGPIGNTGPAGATGPQGPSGATGPAGAGVPVGGTAGQVLKKNSAADFDTSWQADATGAGGGGTGDVVGPASSVDGRAVLFSGATGKVIKTSLLSEAATGEVTKPVLATPPTAAAAGFNTHSDLNFAGRSTPIFRNAVEAWAALQTHLARGQFAFWRPTGNATTTPGVFGMAAPTTVGTATARNVATTNRATRLKRLGYVSAATAAAFASQYSAQAQLSIGDGAGNGGLFYVCRFVPSDAANVAGARMFVGLRNSTAAPTNVEPTTLTNAVGVAQLSTSSNLQIVYGGTTAQAAIDLGVNFPANTASLHAYELTLYAAPFETGRIYYRVERLGTSFVATGVLGTGVAGVIVPAATTLLAHTAWRTNNATLLAVGLDIASIYIEQME